ncbi:MAG: hypothetical protein BGO43_03375 [Gammaproteobacteria bacterium 39-13]|nr:hypothetical protein [Gammaproteobacteria bacterium]OJV92054.1 MAG: hypothetical protein BGO43_03375 [Gammaproteobacteria bacterium 39-13]
MEQGPQKSSLQDLAKQLSQLRVTKQFNASNPVYFRHSNISNAIHVNALSRKLCQDFTADPLNMTSENMDKILDEFDEQFQTLFKKLMTELTAISLKGISGFQLRQATIQHSPLLMYIKDVIGLLNHLDTQMITFLTNDEIIDINFDVFDLFCEWQELQEDEKLVVPSELHRITQGYALAKGNIVSGMYVRNGIENYKIWIALEDSSAELEMYDNMIQHSFDKASEMAYLNHQNITGYNTYYNKNIIDEINILVPFICANAYPGYFKQARENVEKIYDLMANKPWSYSLVVTAFDFYVQRRLICSDNASFHDALDVLEKLVTLSKDRTSIAEDDFDFADYALKKENTLKKYQEFYQEAIELIGKPYRFQKKYACTTEIIYILPSANFTKKITEMIPKIHRVLPSKQIFFSVNKKEMSIKFPLEVSLSVVKQAVDEIGKLFLAAEPSPIPSRAIFSGDIPSTGPSAVTTSTLPTLDPAQEKGNNDSSPTVNQWSKKDCLLPEKEEEKEKGKEKEKEKKKKVETKKKGKRSKKKGNRKHQTTCMNETTDMPDPATKLQSILAVPTEPFHADEFQSAKMLELQGAKGIFVAYNPELSFAKPKKLDAMIEQRYTKMFEHPILVGPSNCNGFKWVPHHMGASLVGKLTCEKYRLFPVIKEINDAGETAFFYGQIQKTKNGKKANRYR